MRYDLWLSQCVEKFELSEEELIYILNMSLEDISSYIKDFMRRDLTLNDMKERIYDISLTMLLPEIEKEISITHISISRIKILVTSYKNILSNKMEVA